MFNSKEFKTLLNSISVLELSEDIVTILFPSEPVNTKPSKVSGKINVSTAFAFEGR